MLTISIALRVCVTSLNIHSRGWPSPKRKTAVGDAALQKYFIRKTITFINIFKFPKWNAPSVFLQKQFYKLISFAP